LGEEGQHLAWAQSIMNGAIYGRDVRCFYGPLMIYPLIWFMKVFGTSVAMLRLYTFCLNITAYLLVIGFLYKTLRFRATFLIASAIYLWIFSPLTLFFPNASYLRVFLGVLPIFLAYLYLENQRTWLLFASGLALGSSIMFSQEVGACSAIAVASFFLLRHLPARDWKPLLNDATFFSLGLGTVLLPILGYFFSNGSLGALAKAMTTQPGLQALGMFGLPFPGLKTFFTRFYDADILLFYAPVFIFVLASLYLIPLILLGRRDRNTLLRTALLVFGIFLFRSALGRSDIDHVSFALPPVVLLLFLFADDALSGLISDAPLQKGVRYTVITCSALALVLFSSVNMYVNQWRNMSQSLAQLGARWLTVSYGKNEPGLKRLGVPVGEKTLDNLRVIDNFLKAKTRAGEYVYFFPNE